MSKCPNCGCPTMACRRNATGQRYYQCECGYMSSVPSPDAGTSISDKAKLDAAETIGVTAAIAHLQERNAPAKPKREVHPSHKMTAWRSTIISTANSDRFGDIRMCELCEGEQAKTVTGLHTHGILWKACPSSEEGQLEARIKRAAPTLLLELETLVKRCDGAEGVRADGSNIDTMGAHAAIRLARTGSAAIAQAEGRVG